MSNSAHANGRQTDVPSYLIDPRLFNSHAVGPAKHLISTPPVAYHQSPPVINASYYAALPSLASGRPYNMPSQPPGLSAQTHPVSLPLTPPTSVTPECQVINPPNPPTLPPPAQDAQSNFSTLPPAPIPVPYTPPPPTMPQHTSPPRKAYRERKVPLSELSLEATQARRELLASCDHDREVFLELLNEPNNGGLAPERVEVLKKTFKHFSLSSLPGSAPGVEANKRARLQGMAEIAFLRAQRARMREYEDSRVAERTETARAGEIFSERGILDVEAWGEERISDGVTVSYSLNGKPCTKEDLDENMSRYPPRKRSQVTEVAVEDLSTQQPTGGPDIPHHKLWRDLCPTFAQEALSWDTVEASRHNGDPSNGSRAGEHS